MHPWTPLLTQGHFLPHHLSSPGRAKSQALLFFFSKSLSPSAILSLPQVTQDCTLHPTQLGHELYGKNLPLGCHRPPQHAQEHPSHVQSLHSLQRAAGVSHQGKGGSALGCLMPPAGVATSTTLYRFFPLQRVAGTVVPPPPSPSPLMSAGHSSEHPACMRSCQMPFPHAFLQATATDLCRSQFVLGTSNIGLHTYSTCCLSSPPLPPRSPANCSHSSHGLTPNKHGYILYQDSDKFSF